MGAPLYDRIGRDYNATRRPDPRLAARVHGALGAARTVVNVGAGTGGYEPEDREVLAVEPSDVMIAQRPAGAAPVMQATAEALPFPDGAFDAAMTVLSDHHWADRAGGLRELRRVARQRVVVLTFDSAMWDCSWLTRDYVGRPPSLTQGPGMPIGEIAAHLGGARIETVPIPYDCTDGFLHAYWRRPEAYLDPEVRANISVFAALDAAEVEDGMARLAADLASGAWHERHGELVERRELDLGYRLLVGETK